MGLATDPAAPLFGVVSRLTWQKGMDLLLVRCRGSFDGGAQFALVGSGDGALEAGVRRGRAARSAACRRAHRL